ncbi:recombinase family protein, partial [Ruminococcaceae bacterium OttesenSCG-928-A11]|nr:recombinase family protein [Ruminococcaceae bacterium OttesenSCG-928-A11]
MTLELEHFNDNFGLRFVSIAEDIDATDTNDYNEIFQIVLVLNEMVPRDCSRKIKSSWVNGVTNGKFMFGTPPFGYERGTDNNLRLEVDSVAARHVQRIFSLYAGGESMRGIAEIFNREKYPSPRAY